MIKLAIVSPCFNEEEVLDDSIRRLSSLYDELIEKKKITPDSFVLFVNDGSKDNTWEIIKKNHQKNPFVYGLCLAGNVGHQNAIMAGMLKVRNKCDAAITIDADLQDDLSVISQMIDKHEEGSEVVYGVKVSRVADPMLKRVSAQCFYKLQNLMGVNTIYNHADFRLMSNKALNYLALYPERNLYLRGMIPLMGLRSSTVDDVISPRKAGSSKYTLSKMLRLAFDGITSFSTKPILWIVALGFISLFITFIMVVHVFYAWLKGNVVPGWTEIMISLWFLGSAILLSVGVIGQYIGKIYAESKHRPLYLEEDYLGK